MNNISVIIPTMGLNESFKEILSSLLNQSKIPNEVIVVDSSDDDAIKNELLNYADLNFFYYHVGRMFPGEARNFGISKATNNIIGLLDSKTVPTNDWISKGLEKLLNGQADLIFGSTRYIPLNSFQKKLHASMYGQVNYETTPGTVVFKDTFDKVGGFIEGVRTADDVEWRVRAKNRIGRKAQSSSGYNLTYKELANDLFSEIKRHFVYQLHTAFVNIQEEKKIIVFSIFLFMMTALVPFWNSIVGWENSSLYIPNITKSYFLVIFLLGITSFLTIKVKKIPLNNYFTKWIGLTIVFMFSYSVYRWNGVVAGWSENSILFVPHLTKIYFSCIVVLGFLYRALFVPITRGIELNFLFPFRWIYVGLIGLLLDIAKVPGFLLGGIINFYTAFFK